MLKENIYDLVIKYLFNQISSGIYRQNEGTKHITSKHIAKYVKICIQDLYGLNC